MKCVNIWSQWQHWAIQIERNRTENDQIRWAAERKMFWRYIQSSLMAIPPFSWPFVVYEMHPPPFWTKTDEEVQIFFVPQFQSVSFFSGRLGGEPNERAPKRIFFFLQDGWEVKRKKKLQRKGTGKQVMRGLITCFFWLQVFFFPFFRLRVSWTFRVEFVPSRCNIINIFSKLLRLSIISGLQGPFFYWLFFFSNGPPLSNRF